MNGFSVDRITFARLGKNPVGNEYRNYAGGRGVCGVVAAVQGTSVYEFSDGRTKKVSGGEIAVFSEKTAYVIRNSENEEFVHYTVNFALSEGYFLPADETYLRPKNPMPFFEKCSLLTESIAADPLRAMSCLYSLLSDVYSDTTVELSDRKEYVSVLPAMRFMETEYRENITVEKLARLCMMSCTNFRRTFSASFGCSPIEYLICTRISRAKELIRHTSLGVSEIAAECGFKDTEHFCRTFKKRTGVTAGAYRENFNQEQ